MEQQYTQFLQDLQEDAYSSQFLTYNRIDYEFGPSGSEKVQEQYPNPQLLPNPVTSTDQPQDPKKTESSRGRARTVFSEEQKRKLMQRFHRQKYISPQERTELATALGLNCKQVKTWYQNRRMKLKRSQCIQTPGTSWDQPSFNPVSSQTCPLTRGLTPTVTKPHLISSQQQSVFSSGQAISYRRHRTSMEHPIVDIVQSSPIRRDLQYPPVSSYFQNFPPAQCSDPNFGNFHKECLMIPGTQSLSFRNQISRSGMGFPAVRIHQSPSIKEDIQCIATSTSYPPSECHQVSSSFNMGTVGRELIVSTQDFQMNPNNWNPVQNDVSLPDYLTLAPVFGSYEMQQSGSADLFSEGHPVTLSGAQCNM
ncbi:uncharacterized protein [Chiloscyllium punctatum]|uniref:uncharacterized protein n=1 Tax=Chiloscyllium punctatum TaxID=137246 RepID=UPI003B63F514